MINFFNRRLTDEAKKTNRCLETLVSLANPTGLSLSESTLKNLRHLIEGNNSFEKLNPQRLDPKAFVEVLGIDTQLALNLWQYFQGINNSHWSCIEEIDGINEQILQLIKERFIL